MSAFKFDPKEREKVIKAATEWNYEAIINMKEAHIEAYKRELSEANKRIAHETNKVKALCAELDRKVRIVLPSECDNSKCAEEWESGDTNGFNRCLSLIKSLNEGAEFVEGK